MKEKKIFIFLNDYRKADPITKYGVQLAKAIKSPALLLSIENVTFPYVPSAIPGTDIPNPLPLKIEGLENRVRPHLNKLWEDLTKIWKDLSYELALGFSEDKVIKLSSEHNPMLLVIEGQNNLNTVNEWFGTTETRIAEKSPCPVLVVKSNYVWRPIKSILYVMDINDVDLENMQVITSLCKKNKMNCP